MTDTFETKEAPRGDVRAFDVRSGDLRWTFHTIPQAGEVGTDTWDDDAWSYTGHAPVWSLFSADAELGYVYMPVSSPTSDMYGGHRGGDNLFGQSLVCVDAETGARVWHYQIVHHGLWNYDLPAAPILVDLEVEGRPGSHPSGRPADEAGVRVRLRPGDRRTDLADRGAPGAPVGDTGRADLSNPAVPDQTARVRSAGRNRGQPDRFHTGAPGRGAGDRQGLHDGAVVHSAVDPR